MKPDSILAEVKAEVQFVSRELAGTRVRGLPQVCRLRAMSSVSGQSITITARFVIPVDGPPLPGGSVTIAGGRIAAVEKPGARSADIDLGNAAILPGLVNAHTHLDLSGLRGCTPPSSNFVEWLRAVIRQRRVQQAGQVQKDIQAGLDECLASGATLIGDIAAGGQSWDILANAASRSVVFYELLGLSKSRAHQSWSAACAWLNSRSPLPNCRPGLSPHAPYSVRRSLFHATRRLAESRNLPLAVHVAESTAERELLAKRSGPMVPFLEELGVYDAAGLVDSLDDLIEILGDYRHHLLVHGNYLRPSVNVHGNMNVIYCPRTHRAFGHPTYPLAELLRSGVRVGLGTDSLASNPDLSLFNEAKFVHQVHCEVASSDILRIATLSGAEALGWERESGSLTSGKAADLAIVALPNQEGADPAALVLDEESSVSGVMIGGSWHKDPKEKFNEPAAPSSGATSSTRPR